MWCYSFAILTAVLRAMLSAELLTNDGEGVCLFCTGSCLAAVLR